MQFKFQKLAVKKIPVDNFTMSPVELRDFLDFNVRRVYFVTSPRGEMKSGGHCHKIEKELFIMVQGSCTALIDQGNGLEEIEMQSPTDAIYVGEYIWHQFKEFSGDAILLALSSTNYNPDRSDYIENYEEYKKVITSLK